MTDPKRQLIAKVWHKDENVSDYVIGFSAIDLGILLHNGFTEISGWYNVMDFVGRCRGQINVEIKPKNHSSVDYVKNFFVEKKIWKGTSIQFMINKSHLNVISVKKNSHRLLSLKDILE